MIHALVLGLGLALHTLGAQAGEVCQAARFDPAASGVADPFHQAKLEAAEANERAAALYKQLRWNEARTFYRQALAADPQFLAARLNLACAFVRQERFAEAADEVVSLLHASYVPWSREVVEAADLGALRNHPEAKRWDAAMSSERQRWAQGLDHQAVFFVGRLRAPVRLPRTGNGVFILGLRQEAFAYLPGQAAYRQLTATDGRVLAILPSVRRRWLAVVTGEKLVRDERGLTLRGVVVETWDLRTLQVMARWRPPSDLEALVLAERANGLQVSLRLPAGQGEAATFRLGADGPVAAAPLRPSEAAVVLDGAGAHPGVRFPIEATTGEGCRWSLVQQAPSADKAPAVSAKFKGRNALEGGSPDGFVLSSSFGVGLSGLSFESRP